MRTRCPFQSTRPLRGATLDTIITRDTANEFQPTRPLRGATADGQRYRPHHRYFNPRAPCGARPGKNNGSSIEGKFQPTRPLRGATEPEPMTPEAVAPISTHAPLAGRDASAYGQPSRSQQNFNPRAPCGARPFAASIDVCATNFNPRAPCGARLHTPIDSGTLSWHFNPRAPRGARPAATTSPKGRQARFQPTRPARGATCKQSVLC